MKGSAIAVPLLFLGVDITLQAGNTRKIPIPEMATSLGSRVAWDVVFIMVQDPHTVGV